MTEPLTPETLAELQRLLDAYGTATGYQPVTDSWFALARGAISALPALLDAAGEVADLREMVGTIDQRRDELAAERDALAAKVERVRALADELKAAGIVSVYESALEIGEIIDRALDGTEADHA